MITDRVYETLPEGFSPQSEVVANYVHAEGKILLLQQSPAKWETGHWGVPAGKREVGETLHEAALRELWEETGIQRQSARLVGTLYMHKPEMDYIFHVFDVPLESQVTPCLSHEHMAYQWLGQDELCQLPLMRCAPEALAFYYRAR
jgi:8-oxo-dGTP pyrophosphatase MutT (NUDIX family)